MRSNVIPVLGIATLACIDAAFAQIAIGDYALLSDVHTSGGVVPTVFMRPAGSSTTTMIQNLSLPTSDLIGASIEIEPATGNLLVANGSTGGTQIWRAVLSGTTVTSQTLLVTLPNTSGAGIVDTQLEVDASNTPTGCLLVLSGKLTAGPGSGKVHRVSLAANAALAQEVPINNFHPWSELLSVTSGADGTIYIGAEDTSTTLDTPALWALPKAGGNYVDVTPQPAAVRPFAVGVSMLDQIVIGGWYVGAAPSSGVLAHFECALPGQSPSLLMLTSFATFQSPPINDIHLDANGADFLVAVNGSIPGFPNLGHVRRVPVDQCSSTAVSTELEFADPIRKIAQRYAGKRYGCACVAGPTVPLLTETAPATPGSTWTAEVTDALPNIAVILQVASNDAQWAGLTLPVDLTVFGAPGAIMLTSADSIRLTTAADSSGTATFSIPVSSSTPSGILIYFQVSYLDPNSSASLPIVTSNALVTST